jgi:hypothetical protein
LSKAISASCKAFFIKYSSVKIFSISPQVPQRELLSYRTKIENKTVNSLFKL